VIGSDYGFLVVTNLSIKYYIMIHLSEGYSTLDVISWNGDVY